MNGFDVRHGVSSLGIRDLAAEERWVDRVSEADGQMEPTQATFTIHDRRDGEPVGTCS